MFIKLPRIHKSKPTILLYNYDRLSISRRNKYISRYTHRTSETYPLMISKISSNAAYDQGHNILRANQTIEGYRSHQEIWRVDLQYSHFVWPIHSLRMAYNFGVRIRGPTSSILSMIRAIGTILEESAFIIAGVLTSARSRGHSRSSTVWDAPSRCDVNTCGRWKPVACHIGDSICGTTVLAKRQQGLRKTVNYVTMRRSQRWRVVSR